MARKTAAAAAPRITLFGDVGAEWINSAPLLLPPHAQLAADPADPDDGTVCGERDALDGCPVVDGADALAVGRVADAAHRPQLDLLVGATADDKVAEDAHAQHRVVPVEERARAPERRERPQTEPAVGAAGSDYLAGDCRRMDAARVLQRREALEVALRGPHLRRRVGARADEVARPDVHGAHGVGVLAHLAQHDLLADRPRTHGLILAARREGVTLEADRVHRAVRVRALEARAHLARLERP